MIAASDKAPSEIEHQLHHTWAMFFAESPTAGRYVSFIKAESRVKYFKGDVTPWDNASGIW